jgi:molybdate transport system substrate-binding protein
MPVSKHRYLSVLVALPLVACGSGSEGAEAREVVVFAAASLTGAFEEIASDLEAEEPGLDVLLSFDASSSLAAQIVAGSPADVFASADLAQVIAVEEEGLVDSWEPFARNRLQVITPADNPAGIEAPEDLARPDVTVVLAAPEVPAGAYARRFFDDLGLLDRVEANVVSNEQDVKDVLTKIRLGEADAGVVYVTDVTSDVASEVRMIDTPDIESARATYGIAVLTEGPHPEGGGLFYERVLSDEGEKVLSGFGFEIP